MNAVILATHYTAGLSGVFGAAVGTILLVWMASRADRKAEVIHDKKILRYGTPVRILGWVVAAGAIFFIYAASKASASQIIMARCVVTGFVLITLILLLEIYLVKISFNDGFIYTRSPWRPTRKIPWTAVSGYSYSHFNKWHLLHTTGHGNIRLSILLSGLGTFAQELEKRKKHIAGKPFRQRSI